MFKEDESPAHRRSRRPADPVIVYTEGYGMMYLPGSSPTPLRREWIRFLRDGSRFCSSLLLPIYRNSSERESIGHRQDRRIQQEHIRAKTASISSLSIQSLFPWDRSDASDSDVSSPLQRPCNLGTSAENRSEHSSRPSTRL